MITAFARTSESAARARLLGSLMTICLLAAPSAAKAGDVDLDFTTPTNANPSQVTLYIGNRRVPVTIPKNTTAKEKRDLILAAIPKNFDAAAKGNAGITISSLTKGTKVSFYAGTTGERVDKATASLAPSADIDFNNGKFATVNSSGKAATFTAGVITSFGTFTDTFKASISNPTISGATIASDFYTFLAGLQSADHFTVTLAGKYDQDLDFTFSHPVGLAGVEFGSTSKSRGVSGGVVVGVPAPPPSSVAVVLFGLYVAARRVWRDDRKRSVIISRWSVGRSTICALWRRGRAYDEPAVAS